LDKSGAYPVNYRFFSAEPDCASEASRSSVGIETCGKDRHAPGHFNTLRLVLGGHSRAPQLWKTTIQKF